MKKTVLIFLFVCLAVTSLSVPVQAKPQTNLLGEQTTILLTGGIFLPRREGFRTVYGSGISASMLFEYALNDNMSSGIRWKLFAKNREADSKLTYTNASLAPVLFYSLKNKRFRIPIGISAGIAFQNVSADFDENDNLHNSDYTSQTDLSMYFSLMTGVEYALFHNCHVGLLATGDKMFTKDPSLGHLGDNGGLSIDLFFRIDI